MSDHDAAPDPIDKAYVQAEVVLGDDEARAARRARVLAGVARQAEAAPAASPSSPWRFVRRRGAGLAAAAVAGLSVLLATQFRQSAPGRPEQPAPSPEEAAPGAPANGGAPPIAAAPRAPAPAVLPPAVPAPAAQAPSTQPPRRDESKPAGSETLERAVTAERRAPLAQPDAPTIPPLPVPPVQHRIEEPAALESLPRDAGASRARAPSARAAPQAFPAAEPAADQAARLGAAAAAGRIGEVKALLAQGIPVDAADADGETALMKSIRAGQPAVAELLRGRGASLDRENQAGESARDMAAAKDDARLNEALGLPR